MFGIKKRKLDSGEIFEELRNVLDDGHIVYQSDADRNTVFTTFKGDDQPMKLQINVEDAPPVLRFTSFLDFQAPMESYGEILEGLNQLNSNMRFGAFFLNPEDGRVLYRYHFIYTDKPSQELIRQLIDMVVKTVDQNDGNIRRLVPESAGFDDPMFQ